MTFTKTLILLMLLLLALAVLGLMRFEKFGGAPPAPPAHLVLEEVRELSELVTLSVPLQQLVETEWAGYTGATRCVLIARGEARVGTDLTTADFELDSHRRRATVTLPSPRVLSATLDHDQTRTVLVDRSGLWQIIPGGAGEAHLVDRALADAQDRMRSAAGEAERIDQARVRTEMLLTQWFDRHGWQVAIHWRDR